MRELPLVQQLGKMMPGADMLVKVWGIPKDWWPYAEWSQLTGLSL